MCKTATGSRMCDWHCAATQLKQSWVCRIINYTWIRKERERNSDIKMKKTTKKPCLFYIQYIQHICTPRTNKDTDTDRSILFLLSAEFAVGLYMPLCIQQLPDDLYWIKKCSQAEQTPPHALLNLSVYSMNNFEPCCHFGKTWWDLLMFTHKNKKNNIKSNWHLIFPGGSLIVFATKQHHFTKTYIFDFSNKKTKCF